MEKFSLKQFNQDIKNIQLQHGINLGRTVKVELKDLGFSDSRLEFTAIVFASEGKCKLFTGVTPNIVYEQLKAYLTTSPIPHDITLDEATA